MNAQATDIVVYDATQEPSQMFRYTGSEPDSEIYPQVIYNESVVPFMCRNPNGDSFDDKRKLPPSLLMTCESMGCLRNGFLFPNSLDDISPR